MNTTNQDPKDPIQQIEDFFDRINDLCFKLNDELKKELTDTDPEFSIIIYCNTSAKDDNSIGNRVSFQFGRAKQLKDTLFQLASES